MSKEKELDQFFTKPSIAQQCVDAYIDVLVDLDYQLDRVVFIEPSAGAGAFLSALDEYGYQWVAGDLDPQYPGVEKHDYLADATWDHVDNETHAVIGNPPFGKRSKLAVDFINKSLSITDTVGFILPVQFVKYLTQKNIIQEARLIHSSALPTKSFTYMGKDYDVRCVFQVWSTKDSNHEDLRIRKAPAVNHPDFEMHYYNCVPDKLYLFDQQWDFVVLRQGWEDMVPIILDDYSKLSKKKQWMFFRSDDNEVVERLQQIDFNALSEKNTSVRGFGKADVVEAYCELL